MSSTCAGRQQMPLYHSEPARVSEVSAERKQADGCGQPTEAKTADECNRDLLSSFLARHGIRLTHGVPLLSPPIEDPTLPERFTYSQPNHTIQALN